ncbi:uncharacterized protein LOC142645184 [Dermatophagoides pteronyssinus]|uniref:uncharacterized protein LOC142645184 n=1 Tax=Dermatophagoides pteronyssinus TaxID=6956 RepID=UPI003F67FAF7
MIKIVDIAVTLLLFPFTNQKKLQTTTKQDFRNIWFPKLPPPTRSSSNDDNKFVECGLDYDIYGLSVINDNYLYQFEKCSIIIYPPPLFQYFTKNFTKFIFNNGYRYQMNEIHPLLDETFCSLVSSSSSSPESIQYSLQRSNYNQSDNYYLKFCLMVRLSLNNTNFYQIFNTYGDKFRRKHRKFSIKTHFVMINNDNEQMMLIHNVNQSNSMIQYLLISLIYHYKDYYNKVGYICITKNFTINHDDYRISLQQKPCYNWQLTNKLLSSIDLSFTVYGKLLLISKQQNFILITDQKLLTYPHNDSIMEYPLKWKSLQDFFTCSSRQQHAKRSPPFDKQIATFGEKISSYVEQMISFGEKMFKQAEKEFRKKFLDHEKRFIEKMMPKI